MVASSPTRRTSAAVVRPLELRDTHWSAALHETALPTGLFPSLGRRFLAEYHRSFLIGTEGVALVAEVDGRPAGFVVGAFDERAHYRQVVHGRGPRLALIAGGALVRRPATLLRFLRTRARRYLRGLRRLVARRPTASGGGEAVAALLHIAVEPTMRNQGLGFELVRAFEAAAQAHGVDEAVVKTSDAASFYEVLGWQTAGRCVDLDGNAHVLLRRHLGSAPS